MYKQTISEKIKQRRLQMFIHSYLYYQKNVNIVSDYTWSKWATELVALQHDYPEESIRTQYYNEFEDWDGSSGAFLKIPKKYKYLAEILYERKTGNNLRTSTVNATKTVKKRSRAKKSTAVKPLI